MGPMAQEGLYVLLCLVVVVVVVVTIYTAVMEILAGGEESMKSQCRLDIMLHRLD